MTDEQIGSAAQWLFDGSQQVDIALNGFDKFGYDSIELELEEFTRRSNDPHKVRMLLGPNLDEITKAVLVKLDVIGIKSRVVSKGNGFDPKLFFFRGNPRSFVVTGSSSLSASGMRSKHELCTLTIGKTSSPEINDYSEWFDTIWKSGREIETNAISGFKNDITDPNLVEWVNRSAPFDTIRSYQLRLLAEEITCARRSPAHMYNPDKLVGYPHQFIAAQMACSNPFAKGFMLLDEVGLGKTIEAGLVLQYFTQVRSAQRLLIVCPSSLRHQWKEEMRYKFARRFHIYEGWDYENEVITHDNARIITTYEMVNSRLRLFQQRKWDLIIFDEATKTKGGGKLCKSAKGLAGFKVLVTGTPIYNSLEEFFNMVRVFDETILGKSFVEFRDLFLDEDDEDKIRDTEKFVTNLTPFLVRYLRKQTGVPIPKRKAMTRYYKLSREERRVYDMIGDLYDIFRRRGRRSSQQFAFLHMYQQFLSSSRPFYDTLQIIIRSSAAESLGERSTKWKFLQNEEFLPQLKKMNNAQNRLKSDLSNKEKKLLKIIEECGHHNLVIFTRFVGTLQRLKDDVLAANLASHSVFAISGENRYERDNILKKFTSLERDGILLSTDVGAEGLNLQRNCHIVINYDLPWSPMRIEQRIGRLQRIGQKKEVKVFNLAAQKTKDALVINALRRKFKIYSEYFGATDHVLSQLDKGSTERDFSLRILEADETEDIEFDGQNQMISEVDQANDTRVIESIPKPKITENEKKQWDTEDSKWVDLLKNFYLAGTGQTLRARPDWRLELRSIKESRCRGGLTIFEHGKCTSDSQKPELLFEFSFKVRNQMIVREENMFTVTLDAAGKVSNGKVQSVGRDPTKFENRMDKSLSEQLHQFHSKIRDGEHWINLPTRQDESRSSEELSLDWIFERALQELHASTRENSREFRKMVSKYYKSDQDRLDRMKQDLVNIRYNWHQINRRFRELKREQKQLWKENRPSTAACLIALGVHIIWNDPSSRNHEEVELKFPDFKT